MQLEFFVVLIAAIGVALMYRALTAVAPSAAAAKGADAQPIEYSEKRVFTKQQKAPKAQPQAEKAPKQAKAAKQAAQKPATADAFASVTPVEIRKAKKQTKKEIKAAQKIAAAKEAEEDAFVLRELARPKVTGMTADAKSTGAITLDAHRAKKAAKKGTDNSSAKTAAILTDAAAAQEMKDQAKSEGFTLVLSSGPAKDELNARQNAKKKTYAPAAEQKKLLDKQLGNFFRAGNKKKKSENDFDGFRSDKRDTKKPDASPTSGGKVTMKKSFGDSKGLWENQRATATASA